MIFISIQKLLLWIYFLVHCSPFIKLEKEVRVLEGFKSFFLLSKSRVYDWFTFIVSVFAVDRTFLFTGSNFSNNFAIAQFSSVWRQSQVNVCIERVPTMLESIVSPTFYVKWRRLNSKVLNESSSTPLTLAKG